MNNRRGTWRVQAHRMESAPFVAVVWRDGDRWAWWVARIGAEHPSSRIANGRRLLESQAKAAAENVIRRERRRL